MCVCVCVCVCACVRACVRACVCVCWQSQVHKDKITPTCGRFVSEQTTLPAILLFVCNKIKMKLIMQTYMKKHKIRILFHPNKVQVTFLLVLVYSFIIINTPVQQDNSYPKDIWIIIILKLIWKLIWGCTSGGVYYLVFTRMPGESYCRRLRSLLLYLCYVFER